MQFESRNPPQFKRYFTKAWSLINQKWLLWLVIVWLVFDIKIATDSFSIKFSKPVCAKVSGLFIATRGGK